MSRGPGKLQQLILALIAAQNDGAWTTSDICERLYAGTDRVEKRHRVSASRALRTSQLPENWTLAGSDSRGGEYVLYNRLSQESTCRKRWLTVFGRNHCSFETFQRFYGHQVESAAEEVAEYKRYYEADALGRVEIKITTAQRRAGLLAMTGFAALAREIEKEAVELEQQKRAILASNSWPVDLP